MATYDVNGIRNDKEYQGEMRDLELKGQRDAGYASGVAAGLQKGATSYTYEDMTPLDRAIANISKDQWNRYVDKFIPFENRAMMDVKRTGLRTPMVQGAIRANLMQQQTPIGEWARLYGKRGGAAGSPTASGAAAIAETAARGGVAGEQAIATNRAAATQNVVEMGRGGADMAISGLGQAAGLATQQTISDWGYQNDQQRLDTNQAMFDASLSANNTIASRKYLSGLFQSATALVGYGAKNGWFDSEQPYYP